MLNFPRWKIVLIYLICFLSIYFSLPTFLSNYNTNNFAKFLPSKMINLGLDLRGGSHLLLEVGFDSYLAENLEFIKDSIRSEFREKRIGYVDLKVLQQNKISFKIRELGNIDQIKKSVKTLSSDLEIDIDNDLVVLSYTQNALVELKKKIIDQTIEIIRRRVDETGTREPIIQRQGSDYILLQVPGLQDPQQLKILLGKTAKLSFHLVNHDVDPSLQRAPLGSVILENVDPGNPYKYIIYKKSVLTGEYLTDAKTSFDENNLAVVSFSFNKIGAKKFGEITKQNAGKALAIVLDNKVISAPMINEPILGGSGIIKGNFSVQSANELSLLLRAGALPAPLDIVEERTVGPSLGTDSIEAGKIAAIVGIISVMIFMFVCYGKFGLFANIALFFNLLFIISVLAIIQATITMPGIAGIVLTMGMAVDANVLIFERIREESRLGFSPFATIDRGFKNAFATIVDSNLTTIFAGLFLYIFGSGAVKGFAVALIVGIITSMFSAVTLTRYIVVAWLKKKKPKTIKL